MKITSLHNTCTAMTPKGLNANYLTDLQTTGVSAAAKKNMSQDQLELTSSFLPTHKEKAPAKKGVDFNMIKESKHIFKTAANGIKANGFRTAGKHLKTFSRGVGVVGHSGRAYDKFQKGKYWDAGKESARAIKDGARLVKKKLPTGLGHGLNLVITVAVADKYYDYLLDALEDPNHKNIDRLVAHSKLVVQNVDDVYELGKFMINLAKQKGPNFAGRLQSAFEANGAEVMQKASGQTPAGMSLSQITNKIIAGLDVGRAVLSGVEVIKDPQNNQKLGQAIKRSVVAGLSVASVREQASWIPSALALGTDLVPDSVYTYLATEARDYYQSY